VEEEPANKAVAWYFLSPWPYGMPFFFLMREDQHMEDFLDIVLSFTDIDLV
jgi:hypothetical protein